ncbi:hypothetical protein VSDG_07295 [Cytospora chrysosperma]|uniref:Iron transport multicopper oxidase FET3 n=1 Tax=Cytospora chrysosperma TaxID=252740 RepID=A0A423VMW2_CYTCH|nr:hypothetical protein VSDG_07295 [Valsa sordida]
MMLSFLPFLVALIWACFPSQVTAETLDFDWNITWVLANPDGMALRPVIGVNNQWPPPVINATKGDRIVAKVTNGLGNETTSLHWHGLYQNGTNYMDGPPGVVQCSISPGHSVTYNFTVDQAGSYWYHSHTKGQYPDGLRQALIIQDPDNPYAGEYDEERIITLSDWYHDFFSELLKGFISYKNPTGAEPVPKSALLNDTSNFTMPVEPGKTYMLHLINVGAFASHYFWIQDHTMKIVEVDGIWVDAAEAEMIYISTAQRYSVLVTMKNDTGTNYPMMGSMDTDLFDSIPSKLNWNVTGWLVYDEAAKLPEADIIYDFDYFDDFNLVPTDGETSLGAPDYTIQLDLTMNNLGDGANYAFFNDISYVAPVVPTIFTALSAPAEDVTNPAIYGKFTNPFVLPHGGVIQLVLNNDDSGKHPFHLHGHAFQVISRSYDNALHFNGTWSESGDVVPSVPMRRDTLIVKPMSNFVIRFRADNPGIWLFHCHIEWHMDSGLAATMIEAPSVLQEQTVIPQDFMDLCAADGTATAGNAAGNTDDYLDLSGQNRMVPWLPSGFTTKGYVALVFSCVSGFLGVATIAWYGAAPMDKATAA